MNYQILNTVLSYTRTSSLYKESDIRDFLNLFEDKTKPCIYNDLMHTGTYQSTVSPEDYVKLYTPNGDVMLDANISSLNYMGPYEFRDEKWHRKVSVKKAITIIDSRYYWEGEGGVLFDSRQLYPSEPFFILELDMVYDANKGKAFIHSIDIALSKPTRPIDANKYSVILKSGTKYDSQVTSAGDSLVFNDFNEAFAAYNDYHLNDEDIRITPTELASCDSYNVLMLKYTPKHLRARGRVGFAPFGAYNVHGATSGLKSKSSGFEFGIDLGYTFTVGKAKMGPYIGLGMSASSVSLFMNDFAYDYPGLISDHNGNLYTRSYSVTKASEGIQLKDLVVPIYWSSEHKLNNVLKLTWDLGVKIYAPISTSLTPYQVNGTVSGVYSDNTTVTDSAEDALGIIDKSFTSFMVPVNYTRKDNDFSAFGNLGMEIRIMEDLSAALSLGYEQGLTWAYKTDNDVYFDAEKGILPLVYSTQTAQDIAVRSFIGCISLKRQAFWMSLGIKYRF